MLVIPRVLQISLLILITAILRSPRCCSLFFVSFPCHEKPPSLEGGETRKQSLRDGLGRCLLLLEVGGEGFSALQTHAENLRPNQLRNRGMGKKPIGTPNSCPIRLRRVKEGTLLPFSKRER
jgi:hypothetical protein